MKLTYRKTFLKDIKKLDKPVKADVEKLVEKLKSATSLSEFKIEPIKTRSNFFRIRNGDYRLGIFIFQDAINLNLKTYFT